MISTVVTAGFGNGTFSGSVAGVVLRGYSIGDEPPPPPLNYPYDNNVTLEGAGTLHGTLTARDGLSGPGLEGSGTLNGPNIRR